MQRFQSFTKKLTNLQRSIGFKSRLFSSLAAHGTSNGELINGVMDKDSDEYKNLWARTKEMYDINLTPRHTCDIELLLNGGFSPLDGFMTSKQYDNVVNDMHLPDGTLWPMPITLDITEQQALEISQKNIKQAVLRDEEGNPIAVMDISDMWTPNKQMEGEYVFGGDPEHPAISFLNYHTNNVYIGGKLHGFQLPPHYDYRDIRQTPTDLRNMIKSNNWKNIVAFQTRNPMHRAHIELTKFALDESNDMNLIIHPVVGMTKPGDIDHHTRVKCYRQIMKYYPNNRTDLAVFPLAMRMGGPREAIWHCIIRKNYGMTHFILGRDHAGPGKNSKKKDFYGAYDARDAAVNYSNEHGMKCLAYEMVKYCPEDNKYYPVDNTPPNKTTLELSGTEVRERLRTGADIPEWFSYNEVVRILRKAHPPKHKQGFTIFFTGLSGSGKTTIANALRERLMELQDRKVTMLDGDYVRKLISSELGFSNEHRNLNIKRIGYIASLISNSGGAVIAAPIAPFHESREFAKNLGKETGGYCEVWISTSLEMCAKRDKKGLYKAYYEGTFKGLTGADPESPYENPQNPDITIDTEDVEVDDACDIVIQWLVNQGYIELEKEELKQ